MLDSFLIRAVEPFVSLFLLWRHEDALCRRSRLLSLLKSCAVNCKRAADENEVCEVAFVGSFWKLFFCKSTATAEGTAHHLMNVWRTKLAELTVLPSRSNSVILDEADTLQLLLFKTKWINHNTVMILSRKFHWLHVLRNDVRLPPPAAFWVPVIITQSRATAVTVCVTNTTRSVPNWKSRRNPWFLSFFEIVMLV